MPTLKELLKEMAEGMPEGGTAIDSATVTTYKGRKIELRETTGLDETIVTKLLGSKFTPNSAGAMLYRSGLMARSVVSIDGEKPNPIRKAEDIDLFWATFTSKEKAQIDKKYSQLNEFKEDDEQLSE